MGTDQYHGRRHGPSAGQRRQRPTLLSASCPQNCPKEEVLLPFPKPQCCPALPPPDPSAQREPDRAWLALPRQKAWGEGQTGEAGTGTMSSLVNSAGPCSLFKALNRGWYLSSAELGAWGCWSWFNTLRHGWKDGEGGRATPDGNMWGYLLSPHALPLPPTHHLYGNEDKLMERHPLWDSPARPFCRPPTSIAIHHCPAGTLLGPPLPWHWHAGRWYCFMCPSAVGQLTGCPGSPGAE